ncbi:MAG: hypothetical protein JW395_2668 [Nitrospira sp.]|nr:hypothetical protein [Nitrospira sp.]
MSSEPAVRPARVNPGTRVYMIFQARVSMWASKVIAMSEGARRTDRFVVNTVERTAIRQQASFEMLGSMEGGHAHRVIQNVPVASIQQGGWCGLHCAHRATTAPPWGLCEHRDHVSCLAIPSDRARSASRRTTRLPFLFYYWMAESRHSPSWILMKVQASPDSVGISSLPSTR